MPATGVVEVKFTFKEGGAFDFHTQYERVRERLQQAVEASSMDGDGAGSSRTAMNGVDVSNVNLDDLPAYQEEGDGPLIAPIAPATIAAQQSSRQSNGEGERSRRTNETPDEPPPGYEEAQMAGLQDEVERRLSESRR